MATGFNYLNFVSEESCCVHHFGRGDGSKYYNIQPQRPLLWRRIQSEVQARAAENSKRFVIAHKSVLG